MTSSINVRRATNDDLEAIVRFQQAMAWETERKRLDDATVHNGVAAALADPQKGFYLVAEADGAVIGSLFVTYEWSDWRNATFWWIQSVYVDAGHRRRGAYRALHERVCELARARGDVCGVRLYTERDNSVAQAVYSRVGMARSHYVMYEQSLAPAEAGEIPVRRKGKP